MTPMQRIGRFYLFYSGIVGGLLFLLLLTATQAAHSTAEALAAVLLGVVLPIPMLCTGIALRSGARVGRVLAVAVGVTSVVLWSAVRGLPEPSRSAGVFVGLLFNFCAGQLYFMPGAVVLGVMVMLRSEAESAAG